MPERRKRRRPAQRPPEAEEMARAHQKPAAGGRILHSGRRQLKGWKFLVQMICGRISLSVFSYDEWR